MVVAQFIDIHSTYLQVFLRTNAAPDVRPDNAGETCTVN